MIQRIPYFVTFLLAAAVSLVAEEGKPITVPANHLVEKNVMVAMRDGVRLADFLTTKTDKQPLGFITLLTGTSLSLRTRVGGMPPRGFGTC